MVSKKDMELNNARGFQTKRYEPGALVEDTMQAFDGDLGFDKFDEEDEDKVLDECFAKVARDGDLSPRQQRKGFNTKKTHEKNIVGIIKYLKRFF
ncbi:hypothetical protein BC332_25924 [Capsicum chinense]|nr:hypothetical protein BC332_25924 [Capsicum chinense]